MTDPDGYHLETGPIRPPNEGGAGSLLIRATRNCPWDRCIFCPFYKGQRFQIREVDDIKGDIDTVMKIVDMLEDGSDMSKVPYQTLYMIKAWNRGGKRTAFLQDSNSLIIPTDQLVEVLEYLVESFPSLERITSYARSDTIARKSVHELKRIREAGLTRLHVGLESGDEEVLELVKKGVTPEQHIEGGKKAKEAGFELSEYVMPGLGGKELSKQHAYNTAKVLNQIDPDYIRMRPLTVHPLTELHGLRATDQFRMTSPHERLEELRSMVEGLEVSSTLCFDHFLNGWRGRDGGPLFKTSFSGYRLPDEKEQILELIQEGLDVPESQHLDPRRTRMNSF